MTKLGVNPPTDGVVEEKKDKDVEKDPKIFTIVQPCPQVVPVQMPEYSETRGKKKGSLCGVMLRIALISILFALFAVALVIAFSGQDGIRSLFGQDRTVILVPEKIMLKSNLNDNFRMPKTQEKEEIIPIINLDDQTEENQMGPIGHESEYEEHPDEQEINHDQPEMQVAILAVPEGFMGEHEDNNGAEETEGPEVEAQQQEQTPDEGIEGNEESVPDEEKNMPIQVVEGGNTPDMAMMWEMKQQQAMRIWRLRRIQQALFQQQLMKELVARAMMQSMMAQRNEEQQQQEEMEHRLAHWQQMQMMRLQQQWQQRAEQEQAWKQQQMAWAMQKPQAESWPQPQHVLFRPHWAPEQEEQNRGAAYWDWQRQAQAEMQRRQWMQWQWAQQQQASQAEVEARAHEQEERMSAWQQAQQQWMQQQAIAQQQQQQQQQQMQMQMQTLQQQQQPMWPQNQPQLPPAVQPQQQQPVSALTTPQPQQQPDEQVPLRPHDASAQQIVNQLQNGQPQPIQMPSIEDRVYQHFQQIAQNFNSGMGFRPLFSSVPSDDEDQQMRTEDIYNRMLNKALDMREQSENATETTTANSLEKSTEPVVIEDSFPKLNQAKTVDGGDEGTEGDEEDESESVPDEEKNGDPLAEFFKFFENEAMKMGEQPKEKKDDSPMPTPAPLAMGNAEVDAAEPNIVETTKTKTTQTEQAPQPDPSAEVEPPKSSADLGAPVPIPITSVASTA